MNREMVTAIVDLALGFIEAKVKATPIKWDDLIFKLAAGQKEYLIDLIMGLIGSKGTVTAADVQALLADPVVIEKLKAA